MKLDDESLDRALLALPLEEPPAMLRAAILAATIYRPAPLFTLAELVSILCFAGALLWCAFALAPAISAALVGAFSNLSLLASIAAGAIIAVSLEVFTLSRPRYR